MSSRNWQVNHQSPAVKDEFIFNPLIFYTFVPFKNGHGVFENQY